jgi:DNA invertase Pin-like site-specific DNA recombinase
MRCIQSNHKLTPEQREEIRRLAALEGWTYRRIAHLFGCSITTVGKVARAGKRAADVAESDSLADSDSLAEAERRDPTLAALRLQTERLIAHGWHDPDEHKR